MSTVLARRTPSGITRPAHGPYSGYVVARTRAKSLNQTNGRGYRAILARDRTAAIVFRPAVANNRQRRVRALNA